MNTYADKTPKNKSQSEANAVSQKQSVGVSTFQFMDNRPEKVAQRKLQKMTNNGPQVSQLRSFQDMANNNPQAKQVAQFHTTAPSTSVQHQPPPVQQKKNNTGLPDNLKTGMESLSGMSLDDVKVYRNSDKPAHLQAHAYAQGSDIHLGPGQEKHLPHEAWHVVQQKQGRVKPTMQMKVKVNINDDAGLEKEADVMGKKAISFSTLPQKEKRQQNADDKKKIDAQVSTMNVAPALLQLNVVQCSIPSKPEWERDSNLWWQRGPGRRTAEMLALGEALDDYQYVDNTIEAKMFGISKILNAIANWRLRKAEDGGDDIYSSSISDKKNGTIKTVPKTGTHQNRKRSHFVDNLLNEVKQTFHELLSESQESWVSDHFTNPIEAKDQDFIYMINGIQEWDDDPVHIQNVLDDPTSIKDAILSLSLVTDTKSSMWCPSGFVVKVPKENIVATHHQDTGTQSSLGGQHDVERYKEAARLFTKFGIEPPKVIVDSMTPANHSEIAVLGTGPERNVEVVGIFIAAAPGDNADEPIILASTKQNYTPETVQIGDDKFNRRTVADMVSGASDKRMGKYKQMEGPDGQKIPIVLIPMAGNSKFSKEGVHIWDDERFITPENAKKYGWVQT